MVSRAFKVFLLMVLSFGGLWAYHYRAADLRTWLELGEPPFSGSNELPGLRSPVERVLDPRAAYSVAAVLLVEPPLERAAAPPPEAFVAADLPPAREEEAPPPDVAGSAEELLKAADTAMYRVKDAGKDGIHVADETSLPVVRRHELTTDN